MSTLLYKATRVYREYGAIPLAKRGIQFGYNSYIRPRLPKRVVSYNKVPVRAARLGDSLIPWHDTNIPRYEEALIRGIRQYVQVGNTVVIVGGGWGVSTVVAANQVGNSGHVVTFEGSKDMVVNVKDTVSLNCVDDLVSIRHSIVGRAISIHGNEQGAPTISPVDLPDCDIIVLDCEGAEIDILRDMDIRPEVVLVETHGMFGATERKVRDLLERANYEIIASDIAEMRWKNKCENNDIYVLAATKSNGAKLK